MALEILWRLGGFLVELFVSMFVWIKMGTSSYWAWGILVTIPIVFVGLWLGQGGGTWAMIWMGVLLALEVFIIVSGIRDWYLTGRRSER